MCVRQIVTVECFWYFCQFLVFWLTSYIFKTHSSLNLTSFFTNSDYAFSTSIGWWKMVTVALGSLMWFDLFSSHFAIFCFKYPYLPSCCRAGYKMLGFLLNTFYNRSCNKLYCRSIPTSSLLVDFTSALSRSHDYII